ncbi:MAG: glycosyl hydrolase family 18 protein [Bacteroidales bacterium]
MNNEDGNLAITRLVALKANYPDLKIILSLGGWGGYRPAAKFLIRIQAGLNLLQSVLQLMKSYRTDGIDLDWEYPVLESLRATSTYLRTGELTYLIADLTRNVGQWLQVTLRQADLLITWKNRLNGTR